MRTRKALHLADFVKMAERHSKQDSGPVSVRPRSPDEEVRVAPWSEFYPEPERWYYQHPRRSAF